MSNNKLETEKQRGDRAKLLLEEPLFKEAFKPDLLKSILAAVVTKSSSTVGNFLPMASSKNPFISLGITESLVICWTLPALALAFKVALTPLTNSATCFALDIAIS